MNEVESVIRSYHSEIDNYTHRYASFDFCYEYFYANKGNLTGNQMQISCLQLWSFLSSWGMITRGNELQGKSYAYLKNVIQFIEQHPEAYDIHIYDADYIQKVLHLYFGIEKAFCLKKQKHRKTLITKTILGVYGCCPAFDSRFCKTFGSNNSKALNANDLAKVVKFYNENKETLERISIPLLPFDCHQNTELLYPIAKIIDMYGFEKNNKI